MFLYGAFGNTEIPCHVLLRQAAQLPQDENLPTTIGQLPDKGRNLLQFLPVGEQPFLVGSRFGHLEYLGMRRCIDHHHARAA